MVRVGNNGVTGVISPDGRATWLIGEEGRPLVDSQGTMLDRVPVVPDNGKRGPLTQYAAFGDIPLAVAFALLIVAMILVKYKAYGKHRSMSMQIGEDLR